MTPRRVLQIHMDVSAQKDRIHAGEGSEWVIQKRGRGRQTKIPLEISGNMSNMRPAWYKKGDPLSERLAVPASDSLIESVLQELVRSNVVSSVKAEEAATACRGQTRPPVRAIAECGLFADEGVEEKFLSEVARSMGLDYAAHLDVAQAALEAVPANLATRYRIMPVTYNDGQLTIAVSDPLDTGTLDALRVLLGNSFGIIVSTRKSIAEACKRCYGIGADTAEQLIATNGGEIDVVPSGEDHNDIDDEGLAGEASVIRFVNVLMTEAIRERATDIHLEPYEDEFRVRYRVDGALREVPTPASIRHFRSAVVSRIKVMAELDIAEKRKPQDGRAKVRVARQEYDLRISIVPTRFGEAATIRLLTRATAFMPLENLGLSEVDMPRMDYLIRQPHGIVLVTGPTGSGKTTTLYAVLKRINSVDRKIITVEDPVEYQLTGITQMQVNPKAGLSFANALRHMLRHDPDVMMVGEIRDAETAEIAVRAALTGHLVFSTVHTNDAPSAVTRLLDMGIEPYLVASSVVGVVAQRLVRLNCSDCRAAYVPDASYLLQLGVKPDDQSHMTFWRGAGCERCGGTGFYGRTAIYEIMLMTENLQALALERRSAGDIRRAAQAEGMRSLREAGVEKVSAGLTTAEEVARVVQEQELETGALSR